MEMKGGVALSQENQSCLRFSLEESLWFRKGQEVEELVSISLDPDITIQENDQYVTIRGSLELTGEYKSSNESNAEEKDESESAPKYVNKIEERDEGINEFSHRFPVDITIPNNRIQSIYDIDVMVETFDYSIPERSCLKLSAELTISGLYGVRQNEPFAEGTLPTENGVQNDDVPTAEEKVEEQENKEEQDLPLFVAEARKPLDEESSIEAANYPNFSYQPEEQAAPTIQFSQTARSEGSPKIEIVAAEETEVEITEEKIIIEESSSSSSSSSSAQKESSSKQVDVKKKKASKKKSMSLTEFFARKEESEDQAKLKICIVQKGDTLDRIAERYDIAFQNLLRVNQLEVSQDVHEGQLLYIPVALAKK